MKRFTFLFTFCLSLIFIQSFAQVEICNNGIDDDGDNFVDCFDNSCATNTLCDGFYLGNDAVCQAPPSAFPDFKMTKEWESPNETTNHLNRVSIGDLDRDGVPEVVSVNISNDRIFILNGATGNIKTGPLYVDYEIERETIIGNINNDGCAEIFTYGKDPGGNWRIYAYDCNLNEIWRSPNNSILPDNPLYLSLANFDGDNFVELYYKDEIVDAHTGIRLVESDYYSSLAAPVAVDILGDQDLELVAGGVIFDVSLPARTHHSGSLTILKQLESYRVRTAQTSTTSVADYDLDGKLDVIITGSEYKGDSSDPEYGDITKNRDQNTTVFYWNVSNNTVATYIDAFPDVVTVYDCQSAGGSSGAFYKNGWRNGTGRINLADIDGDGKLNAVYVSGKYLYALDENWGLKWRIVVNEETSGYTGCTMFDFNGDGESEIVYRDEKFVYIIYGDGTIANSQKCISRTNREYPIVADVDGDGSTELCVTCAYNDNLSEADFCDDNSTGRQRYSVVRAYKSATEPWVPARKVWNQHGYFNVNINDDLTIPKVQQKHHLTFSTGTCQPGDPVQARRPLNTFLNQAPFLDSKGCPVYASPDIAFVENSLSIVPPNCPDRDFTVSFKITNKGDVSLSGILPISFYNGNPELAGAIKLRTALITVNTLAKNAILDVNNLMITGPGSLFNLYIVLNDAGTNVPTPIKLPNTNFLECGYVNNIISAPVNPIPVPITALNVKDNIKCGTGAIPNNGSVRAYIDDGGVENTADYNFYWSMGLVAKAIPADSIGPILTHLPLGDYTVYAVHKTANCNSDTATVHVAEDEINIAVKVVLENPFDNCKNPNAALRAVVNDTDGDDIGDPVGLFTYEWYAGSLPKTSPKLGISHIKTDLTPGSYSVLVTDKATGCNNFGTYTIIDDAVTPTVTTTQTNIICSNLASGSATANVTGGDPNDFFFYWYDGNTVQPTADFTGTTYSGLAAGTYTVVAENKSSQCVSTPVRVTITQTPAFVVTASVTASMTSCDAAKPNGSASANVVGNTSDYSFEWFKGQNTLPANRVATTAVAAGLENLVYTVKATHTTTGCSDTEEVTVPFNVVTPVATIAGVANTTRCTPPDGSVTASVSLDAPSDYTFFWYNGNAVKATTDYADTDNVLSGLTPGQYTVKAIHKTKFCETAPVTATVANNIPVVAFSLTDILQPGDCSSPTGELEVNLNAPGNIGGFDIQWYSGKAPFAAGPILQQTSVSLTRVTGLVSGTYTLVVTNRDNGCQASDDFVLNYIDAHELQYVTQDKVETCTPNNDGSITVRLLKGKPAASFNESDYTIFVYAGTNDPGASGTAIETISGVSGQLNYTTTVPLTPGFYTFVAVSNNPLTIGCRSAPITEELLQNTQAPMFTANPLINNINCTGAPGTGRISLNITSPANYNFDWFEGTNTSAPALGTNTSGAESGTNGEVAVTLPAGQYTVRVTKASGASAGCFTLATYQLFDNPAIVTLDLTNDVDIEDVKRCDMPNMGTATVNFVRENNVRVNATDFDFRWYTHTTSGPQIIAGQTLNILANLTAGLYYVQPVNKVTMCATSDLVAFEIKDSTMNTVGVDLVDFDVPTQCLKPANVPGMLSVMGTSPKTGTYTYTYTWHAGQTTAGAVIGNAATALNLAPGFYTVEVLNNTTMCTITDTYELPLEVVPVTITASASPLTVCFDTPKDGAVFATVTSGSSPDYTYNWYAGRTVKATPDAVRNDAVGKDVINLPDGDYLVIAVDNNDAACWASDTVTITNEQMFPIVTAQALAPLTNCDPGRPDGVATASVGGNFVDYNFNWYTGTVPSGSAFFSGVQAPNLPAGTYSVVASNIFTGCADTTQVTINVMQVPIPMPDIEILSMVTSCVSDNGSLTASVEGNTSNFIFNWYIGNQEKAIPDFTGETYDSLAIGTYSVTATSRITGCKSPLVSEEIIEAPIYPEFAFNIQAASCGEDNGFVAIFITNDVQISSIQWTGNGQTVEGPLLANIPTGIYTVTVTTILGCVTTREVEVKTEIHPFNGVSRNGDGKNDIFYINCIESFPTNHVKIFNRVGTLVYEVEGYDNIDIYFDGRSNKGISMMGTNLPDGTYFYVVDKRDGSKPMAGYLEIVN